MATPLQRVLAGLWWGPARRPFEALARRLLRHADHVAAGPLRGARYRGGLAQQLGIYELQVQDGLLEHLFPGHVFYDVGSHHGYMTLLAARRVGESGAVFAFEPVPESAERARRALAANELSNAEVVVAAVAGRAGRAELFFDDHGPSTVASLEGESGSRTIEVETTTLDQFAAVHHPPDLVKVDVEAAECAVLEGAEGLLCGDRRPVWLIEIHNAENERAIANLLAAHGYRMRALKAPKARQPFPSHILAKPA